MGISKFTKAPDLIISNNDLGLSAFVGALQLKGATLKRDHDTIQASIDAYSAKADTFTDPRNRDLMMTKLQESINSFRDTPRSEIGTIQGFQNMKSKVGDVLKDNDVLTALYSERKIKEGDAIMKLMMTDPNYNKKINYSGIRIFNNAKENYLNSTDPNRLFTQTLKLRSDWEDAAIKTTKAVEKVTRESEGSTPYTKTISNGRIFSAIQGAAMNTVLNPQFSEQFSSDVMVKYNLLDGTPETVEASVNAVKNKFIKESSDSIKIYENKVTELKTAMELQQGLYDKALDTDEKKKYYANNINEAKSAINSYQTEINKFKRLNETSSSIKSRSDALKLVEALELDNFLNRMQNEYGQQDTKQVKNIGFEARLKQANIEENQRIAKENLALNKIKTNNDTFKTDELLKNNEFDRNLNYEKQLQTSVNNGTMTPAEASRLSSIHGFGTEYKDTPYKDSGGVKDGSSESTNDISESANGSSGASSGFMPSIEANSLPAGYNQLTVTEKEARNIRLQNADIFNTMISELPSLFVTNSLNPKVIKMKQELEAIGKKGAIAASEIVQFNQVIQALNLESGNKISSIELLAFNNKLNVLKENNNKLTYINHGGKLAVEKAIARKPKSPEQKTEFINEEYAKIFKADVGSSIVLSRIDTTPDVKTKDEQSLARSFLKKNNISGLVNGEPADFGTISNNGGKPNRRKDIDATLQNVDWDKSTLKTLNVNTGVNANEVSITLRDSKGNALNAGVNYKIRITDEDANRILSFENAGNVERLRQKNLPTVKDMMQDGDINVVKRSFEKSMQNVNGLPNGLIQQYQIQAVNDITGSGRVFKLSFSIDGKMTAPFSTTNIKQVDAFVARTYEQAVKSVNAIALEDKSKGINITQAKFNQNVSIAYKDALRKINIL